MHQLQGKKVPLSISVVAGQPPPVAVTVKDSVRRKSIAMAAMMPGLRHLKSRFLDWARIATNYEGNTATTAAQPSTSAGVPRFDVSDQIEWGQLCCLAAKVRYDTCDYAILQNVRATTSFHRRPWFSHVLVSTVNARGQAQLWHAQMVLMFKAKMQLGALSRAQPREFAYVRWLQRVRANNKDLLSAAGCDRLVWAAYGKEAKAYEVVELKSLLCRQYVVPAWGQGDLPASQRCQFHASAMLEHNKEL
jgi:hypothetical protein